MAPRVADAIVTKRRRAMAISALTYEDFNNAVTGVSSIVARLRGVSSLPARKRQAAVRFGRCLRT
jgi:hypothetical protein